MYLVIMVSFNGPLLSLIT